jgi:hypothetical protein
MMWLVLALLVLGAACWIDAEHPTKHDENDRRPDDGR